MNNNFAIGFILYKPNIETIERIKEFSNLGFEIFIYDNNNDSESNFKNTFINHKINYSTQNRNIGLSNALLELCNNVKISGYHFLLYFDQDTYFNLNSILFIKEYLHKLIESKDVFFNSVVCTTFRDVNINDNSLNNIRKIRIDNYNVFSVYFTINSGSLYMLDKFDNKTLFDKDFFVDGVDYAFCLNAKKNKFNILEVYNVPGLDHDTEQGNDVFEFFGKKIRGRSYNFNRNLDFLTSHYKLIIKSISLFLPKATLLLFKSTFYYIISQIIFKVIKKK